MKSPKEISDNDQNRKNRKLEQSTANEQSILATQPLSGGGEAKKQNVRYKTQRKTTFRPRSSRLDSDTLASELPDFRGFLALFWVMLSLFIGQSMLINFQQTGYIFKTTLINLISRDLIVFALSDLVMVASTLIIVPLHQAIVKRWCPLMLGSLLKYTFELSIVGGAVWWILVRDWPWSQSIAFSMHACVMAMKVHSYLTVNAEFETISRRLSLLEAKRSTESIGDDKPVASPVASEQTENLKQRRHGKSPRPNFDSLIYESLAEEIRDLRGELKKSTVEYPANVTPANYVDFLLIPTLVYELQYPRTNRVRPLYVLEKLFATVGAAWSLYYLIEHFVHPVLLNMSNESPLESCTKLMIPFMLGWMLLFVAIFEGVCNAFAELTRFADRNFYDDWWNSCSFDEFARKWNKPVHEFLLRHVYLEAIDSYKMSKINANILTFLVSSVFHELIAAVVARKLLMLLFFLQMLQLPLMWSMRAIKHKPLLGNSLFWMILIIGMPLFSMIYARDHFI